MDAFNQKYSANEKVVAVLLGSNVRQLCDELIYYGADVVVFANSTELEYPRNLIDTKVISQIALSRATATKFSPESTNFVKPRYMFFAADNIGRQLSATVLANLDSGLASDINKLVIDDLDIKHEHKTKGQTIKFEKTLEMYRPDFSGFLWTTILCLDNRNPTNQHEFHPQACSIIPGVFESIARDDKRKGTVVEFQPQFDQKDLAVKIISRTVVESPVEFDSHKTIVAFGRGIKDAPEENIRRVVELADVLDAEVGISLPISKKPYVVSEKTSSKYMIPDRVIGTSGRKVAPLVYIAAGISGAMQHIAGMKEAGFVVAINPDEDSPIKGESDIFIKGRMEDVIPMLIEELRMLKPTIKVSQGAG
jgi:electron transfer flavoprotein alpha subunit